MSGGQAAPHWAEGPSPPQPQPSYAAPSRGGLGERPGPRGAARGSRDTRGSTRGAPAPAPRAPALSRRCAPAHCRAAAAPAPGSAAGVTGGRSQRAPLSPAARGGQDAAPRAAQGRLTRAASGCPRAVSRPRLPSRPLHTHPFALGLSQSPVSRAPPGGPKPLRLPSAPLQSPPGPSRRSRACRQHRQAHAELLRAPQAQRRG